MKKINWFARLFMSYQALEEHFQKNNTSKEETIRLETELQGVKQQLIDKESHLKDLQKQIIEKDSILSQRLNDLKQVSMENASHEKHNSELRSKIHHNELAIKELEQKLFASRKEKENLQASISDKLSTLSKIDKTFFGSAGNKGKGELGELQLEKLLIQSGLESEFWINNLKVGTKNVEFAIKSGHTDKWIPVDSKVLEPNYDEDNVAIIDDKYLRVIDTQAKKITGYLGKSETANYGLLVLQNDNIYMQVHDYNPHFFQDIIRSHKVYVASPSSFIQFAWSVSHILEIYDKVHREEQIYQKILAMMKSTAKLANQLNASFISMSKAMNSHYPALIKDHNNVLNAFAKHEKLKYLPNLGEKKADIQAIEAND